MKRSREPYFKVKAYLVEKNIRLKAAAKVIGTTENTVSKKLNGLGSDFTIKQVSKLNKELGVPVAYFFEPEVPKKEQTEVG